MIPNKQGIVSVRPVDDEGVICGGEALCGGEAGHGQRHRGSAVGVRGVGGGRPGVARHARAERVARRSRVIARESLKEEGDIKRGEF